MRHPLLLLALTLPFLLAGCTEEDVPTAPLNNTVNDSTGDDALAAATTNAPLTMARRAHGKAKKNGHAGKKFEDDGFTSPLLGLATAPNGDILVADAGAGIATRTGHLEIALPGVTDTAPIGRGSMWATTGGAPEPADVGQGLYRVSKGQNRLIADLWAFEAANDPDGAGVDSNPFDVASLGGRAALVADAAANALLRITIRGDIEVIATFPTEFVSTANFNELAGCPPVAPLCATGGEPELPAQAVPTSISIGPDGYFYVGELKGFPAPTNESNVWRIDPDASGAMCGSSPDCVKVFDGGFTSIIDLAFGDDGMLYVTELDEASWAAVEIFGTPAGGTVNACDLGTLACAPVASGVPIITAITFGKDGSLWATENALIPELADVVRLP